MDDTNDLIQNRATRRAFKNEKNWANSHCKIVCVPCQIEVMV